MHNPIASHDTLPEWSKGVDSSSTSASCVGSNPTGVNLCTSRNAVFLDSDAICAQQSYVRLNQARTPDLYVIILTLGVAHLQ